MANSRTMELPVLPLRGMMIFPGMVLHFDVGRPKSIAALVVDEVAYVLRDPEGNRRKEPKQKPDDRLLEGENREHP